MSNVECHANDEWRMSNEGILSIFINPKSDIPILTIRIPKSAIGYFRIQSPLHYALCLFPPSHLPNFPTSHLFSSVPGSLRSAFFQLPHSDLRFPPFSAFCLYAMRHALRALPFSDFRIPTSHFNILSSAFCHLSSGYTTCLNFHMAIPEIKITGVMAVIIGLRLSKSPRCTITWSPK